MMDTKWWVAGGLVLAMLAACSGKPDTSRQGWYLEKTGDQQAQVVNVNSSGQRTVWVGTLADDSPHSSLLSPLKEGQDNGLFRWNHPGCAELSFVLAADGLKCTTCMQPMTFVPYTASCPLDQQRLPIQGWTAVGLGRPR